MPLSKSSFRDGGAYESLGTALRRDAAEADGWVRHTYSLAAFEDAGRLRVLFRGTGDGARRHLSRQHLFWLSRGCPMPAVTAFNGLRALLPALSTFTT